MRAIFISYRRDDAEGQAGRLFDDLTSHFGKDAVFMDVAAIEPGRDFRLAIDQHVSSCGVLLAVIGKNWVAAKDESGTRRLDNVMDFVRLETASALKRDIPVVPVLVHGATMPRADDLPEDLKELAYRNAVELTHARWDSDVALLVKALAAHLQVPQEPVTAAVQSPQGPQRAIAITRYWPIIVGLVAALGLASFWYFESQKSPDTPKDPTPSSRSHASLVGNWLGAPDCTLIIRVDNGKVVEGSCTSSAARHEFAGVYQAEDTIKVTITRVDAAQCTTRDRGYIRIEDDNNIVASQDGWNGCGVTTGPASTHLERSALGR